MAESCEQVLKELVKTSKRLTDWKDDVLGRLEAAIETANSLLENTDEGKSGEELDEGMASLASDVRQMTEDFPASHKKYHGDVSRIGKAIDKSFVADFACTCLPGVFEGDYRRLLNQAIYDHLLRQSRIDVSHTLCEEVELKGREVIWPYQEINSIVEALKEHNIMPALEWLVGKQSTQVHISNQVVMVKFKLMRLHFLILVTSDLDKALAFCQDFAQFTDPSLRAEVRRLMGCLAFHTNLAGSPYASLLKESLWDDARTSFQRTACALMDLPLDSSLATCIYAGSKALAPIVDMHFTMGKTQNKVGQVNTELMTDIDLGDRCLFHSSFACPVMRRELTDIPMRLRCGHVISQEAMDALRHGPRVKCPYCPQEMSASDATRLYF